MSYEAKGTIKTISEVQKRTSKAGKDWQKLTFTIINNDGYEGREQLYAFEIFGDEKVENFLKYNKVGQKVDVSFNVQTNEWQGKYFTSLQAWKVFGAKVEPTNEGNKVDTEEPAKNPLPF